MTGDNRKERSALGRLADLLAEDVLSSPDAEILAEFKASHGEPAQNAAMLLALFERTVIAANKRRLADARAGVAADRRATSTGAAALVDIAEARQLLRRVGKSASPDRPVTLAARKETELSDADVLSTLADLRELGILPPDDRGS